MFDYTHEGAATSLEVAPTELGDIPAGPKLAAALAELDLYAVAAEGRIDVLIAHRRLAAHYEAKATQDIVAVEDHFRNEWGDTEELAASGTAAEIRAALNLTRTAADQAVWFADAVWRRLPQVGRALLLGDICLRRAREFVYGTAHLPTHTARRITNELVDDAGELTTGQLRARIRKRALEADPEEAECRYRNAVEHRRFESGLNTDGAGDLHIYDAPPDRIAAASRYINHIARSLNAAGDTRTIDQLRVDVALDLLTGATNTSGKAGRRLGGVLITTELATLTGLNNHTGEINGYGPVIADIARQTTAQQHDTPWEYIVRDGDTGQIVATGTTQRRPTTSQERFARARNPVCVFPGCRMPSQDCDTDHTQPWNQTKRTEVGALAPCCRHDHKIRHQHNWTYQLQPNGQTEWTSRLGRKYRPPRDPP